MATQRAGDGPTDSTVRQRRLSVLAQATIEQLTERWRQLDYDPPCEVLRGPETGLVMLRGRMGGGGAPFNFGETTVTRATVRLASGAVGHALLLGRDHRKAKLVAVIDAAACEPAMSERIETDIVQPLAAEQQAADTRTAGETAATKVNFFTMVRGDD